MEISELKLTTDERHLGVEESRLGEVVLGVGGLCDISMWAAVLLKSLCL